MNLALMLPQRLRQARVRLVGLLDQEGDCSAPLSRAAQIPTRPGKGYGRMVGKNKGD